MLFAVAVKGLNDERDYGGGQSMYYGEILLKTWLSRLLEPLQSSAAETSLPPCKQHSAMDCSDSKTTDEWHISCKRAMKALSVLGFKDALSDGGI